MQRNCIALLHSDAPRSKESRRYDESAVVGCQESSHHHGLLSHIKPGGFLMSATHFQRSSFVSLLFSRQCSLVTWRARGPRAICINSGQHDTLLIIIIPFISVQKRNSKKKGFLELLEGSRTLRSEFHGKICLFQILPNWEEKGLTKHVQP